MEMELLNKRRILVKVLEELSTELNFDIQFFSEDWIIVLKQNHKIHFIYGYEWGVNSATSQLIAKDKTATSEILLQNKINTIEHKLFFNYNLQAQYIGQNGCWLDIMKYAQKYKSNNGFNIICKPNKGTGGNDVYKISNQWELESVVQKMFSKYRDLCLCPFYQIDHEYRAIMLNGETLLLYLKEQPYVIGNGRDTLTALVINKYGNKGLAYLKDLSDELMLVLPEKEKKIVSWKHNLGNGAKAIIIENSKLKHELTAFAKQVAEAINITFASIDIVDIGGVYYVMEINSGIMIEKFAMQKSDKIHNYYEITKGIYREAVNFLLK